MKNMAERLQQHERNIHHNRAVMLDYIRRMEARERREQRRLNAFVIVMLLIAAGLILIGLWGVIFP